MNSLDTGWLTQEVAAALRAAAARHETPQHAVAAAAGVSQSQVSKMLRGKRPITLDQLDGMCDLLHLSLSEVIAEAEEATTARFSDDPVFLMRRPWGNGEETEQIAAHESEGTIEQEQEESDTP